MEVVIFEEYFFRAVDLKYLSSEQVEIVKKHLLARCKSESFLKFQNSLIGIGKYLTCREADELFWEAYGIHDDHIDNDAINVVIKEYVLLPKACRQRLLRSVAHLANEKLLKRFNSCEKFHFKDDALPDQEAISKIPF